MAKTVGDLLIKLGVEGIEGVNVLKSSLTALGKAAGPTDKNIRKIRTEILEFANAGQKSTQAIRGVIESFKGLQAQASIGSGVFKQLAADIEGLENALESIKPDAQKAADAMDRLQKIGFPSRVPDAFEKNMKERRRQLQGLRVDSEEYLNTLVGIRNFEAQQAARVARSEVSAAARVARTGMPSNIVQAEQPATLAALRLRIGEVQNEIENLDFTTQDYRDANRELIELQKSLSEALAGTSTSFDKVGEAQTRAARRAEKLANIQQYYGTSRTGEGQAAQRAGGFRDPVTGAMIARGTRAGRVSLAQQPMREISGLYRSIGDIGMSGISADIDRMGKSVKEVTRDIKAATAASNGSANSLQAQRSALTQLRAGLDPTSQDFRELGKEIDKVDRKLSKLGKKRFSLKGAAQTVGAVASAGIFGGAPGAAGALLGAPFGPGGAVIGGGIGTSAGVAAQQISGFTNYAASIRLAEKAMARIIEKENDRVETARRLAIANETIEYAVNRLNVEREDATVGMTRLSAAVLGAGGNIETAAIAFLGTTKAIKATKGSAEDVRGGLTALVQMFSKGKISAEELSGQLGERFPAAVTAFAEANDISTQELQQMLKNGEVGLDRLAKFLVFITKKYSDGALEMASSAEESGERQKRAFDEVRRELGNQLIDVGAKLQEGIADSLAQLTPVIVSVARAVAGAVELIINGIVLVVKNFRNLIDTVLVLAGGAVLGALISTLVKVGTAMGAKGFAFSVALLARFIRFKLMTAIGGLILKLRALALTMAKNPITLLALGFTALGVSMFRASQKHKNFIDDITSGVVSLDDAGKRVDKYKKRLETLNKIQAIIEEDPSAARGLQEDLRGPRPLKLSGMAGRVQQLAGGLKDPSLPAISVGTPQALAEAQAITSTQISGIQAAMAGRAPTEQGPNIEQLLKNMFAPSLQGDGDGDGDKDITDAQLKTRIAGLKEAVTFKELEAKFFNDIRTIQADQIEGNKKILAFHEAGVEYARARTQLEEELLDLEQELGVLAKQAELDLGLITEEQFKQFELEQEMVALKEKFNALLINEKLTQEEIDAILEKIRKGLKAAGEDPSFKEGFLKGLEEMMDVTPKLVDVAIGAVQGLGDAIHQMVTTGKADFKELAASVLSDISRIMIQAALAGALKKMLGSANGNVIQGGRIKPYAQGGVVSGPTVFPMADGNIGLMGEAGAEAIMPLKRGPSGRLGVEVTNQGSARDAMNRYSRRSSGGASGGMASEDEAIAAVQGSSAAIDVRYSVERINNVDYVTADQFQQGLQQAAAQGAQRGEQQTLRRLQMSSSTRRRIGV